MSTDFRIISTGSHGNALLFGNILLDCGVPFKEVQPYVEDISVICLTHRHL